MSSNSKMVQSRLDNGRQVQASVDTHFETCVQAFIQELSPYLPQGQTLDAMQVKLVCQAIQKRYQHHLEGMQQSDEAVQLERGETLAVRAQLDRAVEQTYDMIINFKQSIRQKYGAEYLKQLRLQGGTPRHFEALLQQCSQLQTWCEQPQNEFPTQVSSPFEEPFQKTHVLRVVQDAKTALHKAVDQYRKEQREDEAVFQQKNLALQKHDQVEKQTVQFFRL
ncbi:MAG: hypothetical protein AAGJ35_10455, partial [Myxococcota bacterium]